ncbi:PTS sugar transporter subunit IIA [Corticicoccus populi]|uniref:PTS sugar transporter subunit IIA n=1 Tax=Corticicoccus populi TaxID=1812821 RepID=A0ABW5WWF2_9STAP
MSNVAVIVASHGEFAKHALSSAEMIVGTQENYGVLSLGLDFNLNDARRVLEDELKKLDRSSGTVILVDIFGGTPSNISGALAFQEENILIVSGLNMPLLLDLLSNRERSLEDIAVSLENTYKEGFVDITKKLKEGDDEDECEIL